jgi:hypothetical protein
MSKISSHVYEIDVEGYDEPIKVGKLKLQTIELVLKMVGNPSNAQMVKAGAVVLDTHAKDCPIWADIKSKKDDEPMTYVSAALAAIELAQPKKTTVRKA